MTALKITVEKKSEKLIVLRLKGEFEGLSAVDRKNDLLSHVQDHAAESLCLDLADIAYIDSTTIGILLEMAAKAAEQKLKFGLIHANDNIKKVLSVTKVDKAITLFDE